MRFKRPVISYANVVSTLALFVALGGTAVATGVIDGKKIKRGSITGKQIKKRSVPGADLRPDSVRGRQVRESSLAKVPAATRADSAARADSADSAARAGSADFATNSDRAETAARADFAAGLDPELTSDLTDSCPAVTTLYAGVCIETASKPPQTWPVAATVCGDDGGRLPELYEMEGFRQLAGVTLDGTEHTATYLDLNGLTAGGGSTVGIADNGALAPGFGYGSSNARFRCVYPATNR